MHEANTDFHSNENTVTDGLVANLIADTAVRLRPASALEVAHPASRVLNNDIALLRGTLLALVRRDGRDLTARQLTVFLTVYIDDQVHSVSSLAELLRISRPGITRVMDRLVQFDLVSREEDQRDRRRVLVRRTIAGAAFCDELLQITQEAAAQLHTAS